MTGKRESRQTGQSRDKRQKMSGCPQSIPVTHHQLTGRVRGFEISLRCFSGSFGGVGVGKDIGVGFVQLFGDLLLKFLRALFCLVSVTCGFVEMALTFDVGIL